MPDRPAEQGSPQQPVPDTSRDEVHASAAPGASHHAAAVPAALAQLLALGVQKGIISSAQRERLLELPVRVGDALPDESSSRVLLDASGPVHPRSPHAISHPAAPHAEPAAGLNVVSVAYGLGALLVLFAAGWFLIDRWARLGPFGVLAVAVGYAAVLVAGARWLTARRFAVAAGVCTVLALAMTPLAAWSLLSLAGRWPDPATRDPLLRDTAWMAWQWLVLDLSLLLSALVVLRQRPTAAPTWVVAVALWGSWWHVGQLLRGGDGPLAFERWVMLANGLALLLVAERVERWQRAAGARGPLAADGMGHSWDGGDYANGFWVTGAVATAVAYLAIWGRAEPAWRHLLPLLAFGLVALSLYLRRRSLLLTGVLGLLGYLAYLAGEVFRDYVSFPILVAGFGILLIFATVWTQTRFPALVERLEARRSGGDDRLPWSPAMAGLPLVVAVVMAAVSLAGAGEERRDAEFRQRLAILRLHSGSVPSPSLRPRAPAKPLR